MLLRLAYLGVTNAFAMLRLLSMSDREKDMEILALRHQITVLERQLSGQRVLNHFHRLCREFGVPRTTVHDLRHLAATISITAGVPLTVVSKTLRHATLSTTANIYGHLTTQAARDAVDHALTSAGPIELPGPRTPGDHTTRVHNQRVVTRTQLRKAS
ncbi:tyrosine-type recombinase/integrase [Streptomyces sp. NRRL WC-3742]|uniref:tyrosine-type recombinase/integrase n=1 Tax=Streptomyces sp. NRRL WC-3742 TaxID=1463934 RepID=UPI000561A113|nr:tyrosine-type recombinase/integrase [Streptomyces sp. NRRL WC-3742]